MKLQDATGIVTGAGSGIGRELARAFAAKGAHVVCCGRREQPLRDTVELIASVGGSAEAVPTDIADNDQVTATVERVASQHGRIDLLFNNAGLFGCVAPVWNADPEVWWRDVTVNLLGTMQCCRAVLPHMIAQNSGLIVNMSGGGATDPLVGSSGYGVSKAAILRLTDTLAGELARKGSSVIALAMDPGFNETDMTRGLTQAEDVDVWMPHVNICLSDGTGNKPEDVARCAAELAEVACPEFAGRVFCAPFDVEQLVAQAAEMKEKDTLTLRLRKH